MSRGTSVAAVHSRRGRWAPVTCVGLLVAGLLTSCGLLGDDPGPGPTSPAPIVSVTPSSPSAEPAAPALAPEGTAADNLPLFASVTAEVWASDQQGSGRAYIDALIAAGFDRERMQVTEDRSTVGNAAESLQFSVAWGKSECLIGQVGPSTGEPVTAVMPQLAEGRCLIGTTRAIDW